MRAEEDFLVWEELQDLLNRLQLACREMDLAEIREILLEAVDGFEPKEEINGPLWDIQSKDTPQVLITAAQHRWKASQQQ